MVWNKQNKIPIHTQKNDMDFEKKVLFIFKILKSILKYGVAFIHISYLLLK